jgi:VanZ family protein
LKLQSLKLRSRKWRGLGVAGAWGVLAAIVVLSVMPSPPSADFESSDKVGHLAAYGVLMLSFSLLYEKRRAPMAAAFIGVGVALEFVQGALGYRSFEVADMAANALGVLLGWGAALPAAKMLR